MKKIDIWVHLLLEDIKPIQKCTQAQISASNIDGADACGISKN